MNVYAITLFLHIVGALGFFMALGLEWTGLWQLQSAATLEQVRPWMGILKSATRVGFISMLITVITGIYMMVTVWRSAAWLTVTIGALVLVIALSLVLTSPRMAAMGRALSTEKSSLSHTFYSLANHPLLWISLQTRVAITLGIVLLKTVKPSLDISLLIIGIAGILGLVSALPMPRRQRMREGSH